MAMRHREIVSSLVDRENITVVKGKVQPTKQVTRRPALNNLSNKVNVPHVSKKQDEVKESKAVVKDRPTKKEETTKSYSSNQLDNVFDPDADSKNEPLMVTEYLADIYSYLRELEAKFPVKEKFLEGHKSTPRMRAILVNWLVHIHINFSLCLETLHMCISIIDRYLQHDRQIGRQNLQLVGVSALLIACKYEELFVPEVCDFEYVCDNSFKKKEILKMELVILTALECNLGKPLSIHFLRRYSKIAQVRLDHHNLSKYLLELALLEYEMCHIKPSLQAAAACCLAMSILNNATSPSKVWTPTLVQYTTYKYSDFKNVVVKFACILVAAETSKHQSVRSKYSDAKYNKISANPKLKGALVKKLAESAGKV